MAFQNIVGRLVDVIFGYDFFVSYTWADGSKYAHSLYEKLKAQGFTVFFDEEDYARGDNWTLLGRRALKKTRQLVLIATPRVHESAPVLKELTAFQSTGRRIIPIEIGDSLNPQKYPESPVLPFTPAELLKVKQPLQEGKIPNEAPPEVVRELRRGFQHVRQAQKRVRFLLIACVVLLGLSSIAAWQAIEANRQKHEAVKQEAKAKDQTQVAVAATKRTSEIASRGNVSLARYSEESGKNAQALAHLAQALRLNPENREASGFTAGMLTQLSWHVPLVGSMRHDAPISSAQFSPDGQRVVTVSDDFTARLWDAASGKAIGEPMKHEWGVKSAQFSPDGQRLVTASLDKTALWDAASGKAIGEPMKHEDIVNSVQFSPDGQRMVTASGDNTARLWDAVTMTDEDTKEDILLLAELAEATSGVTLETVGQAENLKLLAPEQVRASRDKIATKLSRPPSKLTPLQQFLKWSVSDRRSRTISSFSHVTVSEWLENRIKEGTVEGLRAALEIDPAHARLTAYLGRGLADWAVLKQAIDPDEARRARAEAHFLTSRALKLAPDNEEVKKLRDEVVKLLGTRDKLS